MSTRIDPGRGPEERFFGALLRLFPADFRERFAGEMRTHFRDQQRDARNAGRLAYVRFFNHGVVEQPLNHAVQGARAQLDLVVGPACNLFADDVTVLLAVGKRQQDVEERRSKRQIRFDCSFLAQLDHLYFPAARLVCITIPSTRQILIALKRHTLY